MVSLNELMTYNVRKLLVYRCIAFSVLRLSCFVVYSAFSVTVRECHRYIMYIKIVFYLLEMQCLIMNL
jgi:hypothetical protein